MSKGNLAPLSSTIVPNGLKGNISVPGDKSISHRSLLIPSQAIGVTHIKGLLEGEDVINTAKALQAMGVDIRKEVIKTHSARDAESHETPDQVRGVESVWIIKGVGTGGLSKPESVIDCGNSGTGVRLLMGLTCSYDFSVTFTGDASLRKRPMGRVIKPLEQMGAIFQSLESGVQSLKQSTKHEARNTLPLTVRGSKGMWPISYTLPMPSAQVKSAILLAALNIPGKTTVIEPEKTRDHTELMLRYLGADIEVSDEGSGRKITITGQPELKARDINVPGDPSSAAFPIVAALIVPGSHITVKNVCINPLRTGLYTTLKEMGADIKFTNKREEAGEQIADIEVKYSKLKGVNVPAGRAPSMIDEYPILSIAASVASGKTIMNGLAELKVKESDRLAAIAEGLKACGVTANILGDNLIVEGGNKVKGGTIIKTYMDHRLAMSFLVMGMISEKPVTVDDGNMINTSFPGFVKLMNGIGGSIK